MTASSNIAGVIKPIGIISRGFLPCCSGCVCKIEEIPVNKKKKKKKISVYEILNIDGEISLLEMKERRCIVNGKRETIKEILFFPR
jgi:hypothetical protein